MNPIQRAAWLAMAAVSMFFFALTYAYLYRRGLAATWLSPGLGLVLAANTLALLASSLALHRGRAWLRLARVRPTLRWVGVAFLLGVAFLAGQALAWRWLLRAGVYVSRNPDSGFFFLVTAVHAAHLALALALLGWVFSRAWRGRLLPERPLLIDVAGIVWHCLDATWCYVFLVLMLWRG